jgi:hypothetical protein
MQSLHITTKVVSSKIQMFKDKNSHHRCEYNNNIIFPLHLMGSKIPFGFCCALLSFEPIEDERMLNIKDPLMAR